jgi:hypothetical protein
VAAALPAGFHTIQAGKLSACGAGAIFLSV